MNGKWFKRFAASLLVLILAASVSSALEPEITWDEKKGGWEATLVYETDVQSGGEIIVEDFVGDLSFIGGSASKAKIKIIYFSDKNRKENAEKKMMATLPDIRVKDHTIRVVGKEQKWRFYGDHGYSLTANLPAKFNIDAETSGGDIRAENFEGVLDLSTSGGDVKGRHLSGDADISTSGGDIELFEINATMTAATSGGDISLEEAKGDMAVATSGGDITVRIFEGGLTGSTSGGDIRVSEIKAKNIEMATSGGDILIEEVEVDNDGKFDTSGGDIEMSKTIGRMSLTTSGGTIDVERHEGYLEATTSAGDVDALEVIGGMSVRTGAGSIRVSFDQMAYGKGEKIDITVGHGDIDVSFPADVKAYIEATIQTSWDDDDIISDFPLDHRVSSTHELYLEGEINGGGIPVQLETGSGTIRIRKR